MSENEKVVNNAIKDKNLGFRCTGDLEKQFKKELLGMSSELGYNVTQSAMLEYLVCEWLKTRGVPEEFIVKARMNDFERKRQGLLRDFRDFWYLVGHEEANIARVKEIYDGLSPEEQAIADSLLAKYNDLKKEYLDMADAEIVPEIREKLVKEEKLKDIEEKLKRIGGGIWTNDEKRKMKILEGKIKHLETEQEKICRKYGVDYEYMDENELPIKARKHYKKLFVQMEDVYNKLAEIKRIGKRRADKIRESVKKNPN